MQYEGIPCSHAWPILDESNAGQMDVIAKRMITNAQVIGVIISVQTKLDRGFAILPFIAHLRKFMNLRVIL